jgi:subtilisin family serine protease
MASYVILKDANARRQRSWFKGSESLGGVPSEPEVSVENLEPQDLRDTARDPLILDFARTMPTRLIAPTVSSAVATAGPTWGIKAVGAHKSPSDGHDVLVCVLDTGIDASHPAFAGVDLVQKDFSGSGNGDAQGHGTHCAGTVFGRDVAGTRIGVARGVSRVLIGKVLGNDGRGGSDMLFNAMLWASSSNAKVISMSLGFDFPGLSKQLVDDGFPVDLATSIALEGYRANLRVFDSLMGLIGSRAAFNGGAVVLAASGNESKRQKNPNYEVSASVPAAAKDIVSVGALGEANGRLKVADFSNTNPILSAPGVNVVSAKAGGGLVAFNGTSMACPHAAGVAALWWQSLADASIPVTASAVVARLRTACRTDLFLHGVDVPDRGDGLVQAPA